MFYTVFDVIHFNIIINFWGTFQSFLFLCYSLKITNPNVRIMRVHKHVSTRHSLQVCKNVLVCDISKGISDVKIFKVGLVNKQCARGSMKE